MYVVIAFLYCVTAVLLDITGVMFNKRFMDEVFKPQAVYPKKSLRAILERFAHASVMRLNPASMDKVVVIVINLGLSVLESDAFYRASGHLHAILI